MATLEDAAEELVVRLKGLDSEIEESHHGLEELRGQVVETSKEVETEWSGLTQAVGTLLERLRGEQEQLEAEVREAIEAMSDPRRVVQESGAEARSEIGGSRTGLESLSKQATGLEPAAESLVTEAGEDPAHSLAARAQAVEQDLARALDDARGFLQEEVASALDQLAEHVRERCQGLRTELAEQGAAALQASFEDWESKIDELEAFVSSQGFLASHSHARAVVDWALEECKVACEAQLDAVQTLVEEAEQPLEELARAVQTSGGLLAAEGSALAGELESARNAASRAASALGEIQDLLATYSFVEA